MMGGDGGNAGSTKTKDRIPLNSIGTEIGVWRGDTSEKFLVRVDTFYQDQVEIRL